MVESGLVAAKLRRIPGMATANTGPLYPENACETSVPQSFSQMPQAFDTGGVEEQIPTRRQYVIDIEPEEIVLHPLSYRTAQ
jgi:hypothetical protein